MSDGPPKPDMRFMLVRKRRPGSRPHELDDPAFRARAVSMASTGMTRQGVAAMIGKPWRTLYDWLARGQAEPKIEPWGSFSVDYLRAERGLQGAAQSAIARKVRGIHDRQEAHDEWLLRRGPEPESGSSEHYRWATQPPEPTIAEYEWLMRLLIARHPEEYGTHALRQVEKEPDGAAWLERRGLTHDQLRALVSNPPEEVRAAMLAEAKRIIEMLTEATETERQKT